MRKLYIAEMLDYGAFHSFRIIEKVETIDGPRDRITNMTFGSLEEAQAFVDQQEKISTGK